MDTTVDRSPVRGALGAARRALGDRRDPLVRGRLADVLRLTFACLAAVKGWDVWRDYGPVAAVAWLAVCAACTLDRRAWWLLAGAAFVLWGFADGEVRSTHIVLIGLVAMILAADRDVDLLLRTQVTALYLFATLNKVNGDFLRGEAIAPRTTELPLGVTLEMAAAATVVVEMALAYLVWTRSRWALPVAVMLHGGIVGFMSTDLYELVMLTAYNGLVVVLVWWVTRTGWRRRELSPEAR